MASYQEDLSTCATDESPCSPRIKPWTVQSRRVRGCISIATPAARTRAGVNIKPVSNQRPTASWRVAFMRPAADRSAHSMHLLETRRVECGARSKHAASGPTCDVRGSLRHDVARVRHDAQGRLSRVCCDKLRNHAAKNIDVAADEREPEKGNSIRGITLAWVQVHHPRRTETRPRADGHQKSR